MDKNLRSTSECYNSLEQWYKLSSAADKEDGRAWYGNARQWIENKAQKYSLPVNVVAGVVAILSPANKWERNLEDAENVIQCHIAGDNMPLTATYKANSRKAAILLDESSSLGYMQDRDILPYIASSKALKCKSFYSNMLHPRISQEITIDRWIIQAAGVKSKAVSLAQYKLIAQAIKELAVVHGLKPCQVQATVWLCIRRGGNLQQPHLF